MVAASGLGNMVGAQVGGATCDAAAAHAVPQAVKDETARARAHTDSSASMVAASDLASMVGEHTEKTCDAEAADIFVQVVPDEVVGNNAIACTQMRDAQTEDIAVENGTAPQDAPTGGWSNESTMSE